MTPAGFEPTILPWKGNDLDHLSTGPHQDTFCKLLESNQQLYFKEYRLNHLTKFAFLILFAVCVLTF